MAKTSLITTGINGLVGSKFADVFKDKYEIDSIELRHPVRPIDITNYGDLIRVFEKSEAESVIHLAAFTNVTAAWKQNQDKTGVAYQVNVVGTKNIIKACQETDKHLIHISTAYVFDGEKESMYTEEDEPNPIEWYGQTKWEAEQAVMKSDIDWTILRIDQPFRSDDFEKQDLAHKIIDGLKNDSLYPMFSDHYFGPTFIDDFALVLDFFVQNQKTGLFHASTGEKWSDYKFAQLIKEVHDLSGEIKKGDLNLYLESLKRPYQKNTALDVNKLRKVLDFPLHSVEQAVEEIRV